MLHQPGPHAAWRQLPQLLHAERVRLRVRLVVEPEALDEHFRDAAACAFGDHRRASAYFGAGSEVRAGLAALFNAHVAELHARDGAIVVVERLGCSKAREHVDAKAFGFLREPRRELAQRDDDVALVVKLRRQRQWHAARASEEAERIVFGRHADARW